MKIYSGIRKDKKELYRYFVIGMSTTVFNVVAYYLLVSAAGMDYWLGNAIAIVGSKIYAYLTNKFIVFHSHCSSFAEALMEFIRFVFARGFTGLVDYFCLIFAVEVLCMDQVISKSCVQVVVIILNYFIGKKVVFR